MVTSREAPPSPTLLSTSTESSRYEVQNENNPTMSPSSNVMDVNKMDCTIRAVDLEHVRAVLSHGPCRFAVDADMERPIKEQIDSLTMEEKMCYDNLKCKWEEIYKPFNDYMYLRFARCSPGPIKFQEKIAWNVMLQYNRKYDTIRCIDSNNYIEKQLLTKTIFPLPNVRTFEGEYDMLYFRPSRYYPLKKYEHIIDPRNNHEVIIENLVYVINAMVEKERSCTEGIGILIYMNDWLQKENFTTQYFYQFLKVLQGSVPVRVRLCLLVNPPNWFQKVWSVMRLVLSKELRQMIHMINESQLSEHLQRGCAPFLPDDMNSGTVPTDDMVNDFITYRKYIENLNQERENKVLKQKQELQNRDQISRIVNSSSSDSQDGMNPDKGNSVSSPNNPKYVVPRTVSLLDNISFNGYNRTYSNNSSSGLSTHSDYENNNLDQSTHSSSAKLNNYVVDGDGQIRVDELLVVSTGEQLEL